jgi:hypothetical protein
VPPRRQQQNASNTDGTLFDCKTIKVPVNKLECIGACMMIARFFSFIEIQRAKGASSQRDDRPQAKATPGASMVNSFDTVGSRLCAMSREQFREYLRRHADIWYF